MRYSKLLTLTFATMFCQTQDMVAKSVQKKTNDSERLNILLITADDLNCSTTPMFGCNVPNLMPNIERLSKEGILFRHAHVCSGASQVSRGGVITGLYPHSSGIDGFYHTDKNIPTVLETLRDNGYTLGVIGKVAHSTPKASMKWDMEIDGEQAHFGRDPQLYYETVKTFMQTAKKKAQPFFFMANSHDPHRPWAGSDNNFDSDGNIKNYPYPEVKYKNYPEPEIVYRPEEIEVPGFVPDIPDIRLELAQYYSSVHRLDQTVDAIIKALDDLGLADKTIVFFLLDNGMSLPFAKTNNYLHSTHTPLIVRWPGTVEPGRVDKRHLINGVDFMPTVLEAIGIDIPSTIEGRSYCSILKRKKQSGRKYVYTEFTENAGRSREPMRGVQSKRYGYIFNVWSNGVRTFKSETTSGISYPSMVEAGKTDPGIQARINYFLHRVPEEFYDYKKDPDALHNLINDPEYQKIVNKYRKLLEKHLKATSDPVLESFIHRSDKSFLENYMREQLQYVQNRDSNKHKGGKRNDRTR